MGRSLHSYVVSTNILPDTKRMHWVSELKVWQLMVVTVKAIISMDLNLDFDPDPDPHQDVGSNWTM